MKTSTLIFILAMTVIASSTAQAAVPQIIEYQSSITVGGIPYNGVGHFKFAFISADKTTTYWSNDGSSANASEPQKEVSLAVAGGQYSISLGDTTLTNMVPIPPTIFTNAAVHIRIWFSDGQTPFQQVSPDQEFTSVGYAMTAANVAEGAVTAAQLADGAVTASKIASGAVGPAQLAPNAVAGNLYASGGLALSASDNATNLLAAGLQKIGKIITDADKWTINAPYCPNPKVNATAVWAGNGMLVWGGNNAYLRYDINGGFYDAQSDSWTPISTVNAPTTQSLLNQPVQAVWTGEEMILQQSGAIWKIYNKAKNTWRNASTSNAPPSTKATITWTGSELVLIGPGSTSRKYDPANDVWKNLSITNGPASHSAVWTGSELIVWGGTGMPFSNGAIYNPSTDTWRAMSTKNAPTQRSEHKAVWTGYAMIVWGGMTSAKPYGDNTGGIYYPSNNTWKAISTLNAPTGRRQFASFWTGKEFLVFGGVSRTDNPASSYSFAANTDGGKYNPATDSWSPIDSGPLEPVIGYSSVWTGSELLIFGGGYFDAQAGTQQPYTPQADYRNAGIRYNPDTGVWRYMACAPVGRVGNSAVWTGSEYIIWGGATNDNETIGTTLLRDGARYNPKKGAWTPISTLNAPPKRKNHQAVWTGKEMIVWGGVGVPFASGYPRNLMQSMADGGRYDPALDRWFSISTNGAPSARTEFSMVWSGKEAIVFGGFSTYKNIPPNSYLNSGGRYDPASDSWRSVSVLNAPSPRHFHAAVWTGDEMVVWGGSGSITPTTNPALQNSGARYNPVSNTWTPMSALGAPRGNLTIPPVAIWTGEQVIIWGHGAPLGMRYQPDTDSWQAMNLAGLPSELIASTVNPVWTGAEMLLCSISQIASRPTKIGRYDPVTDQWTVTSATSASPSRTAIKAVWADKEMILFGGYENNRLSSSLLTLKTSAPVYLYGKP